jgi:hypothetical protein
MNMKRLAKQLEDILTASAFAEAGDFKTAQEILKEGRRILLVIKEGHLDKKTFKYAMNSCKRVVANLDILYVSPLSAVEEVEPELSEFISELENEGINYRLIRREGCLKKEIKNYTDSHDEIVFAVIESSDALEVSRSRVRKLSEAWQNLSLKCPLVVVMDSTHA